MNLKFYSKYTENKLSEKAYIQNEILSLKQKKKKLKIQGLRKQKALEFVKDVALKTQRQLEYHLSDMVSAGLNSVFDQAYDFDVNFELRRGKTECDLYFRKGEDLIDPLRFSGLGAADVAAFSLRCASWSMSNKYRNVLILDEPVKHLKGIDENKRFIELMKTISHKLKLQIICISDERASREDIIQGADKVFKVTQRNGRSRIKVL